MFNRNKSGKQGLAHECRICKKLRSDEYYQRNREKIIALRKAKREENIEQARAYHRLYRRSHAEKLNEERRRLYRESLEQKAKKQAYYQEHAEQIKALRKVYQKTCGEKIVKYRKARYQEHAEHFKTQKKEYYQENVKQIREKKRNHRKTHPELYVDSDKVHVARRRTQKAQAGGNFTIEEWQRLKAQYNYTCLCCRRQEPEIRLTADHVIPLSQGGDSFIENIQPLCTSCNSKKHNKTVDYRTERGDKL